MSINNSIISIKEFFDRHNGLQRTNRYSINFQGLPSSLPQIPPEDFKCGAVAMGGRAIDAMADNLAGYGSGRLVPRYQKFVGGVLLAFPVTGDNFILDFFNSWFNLLYSGGRLQGNYRKPFQLNYYDEVVYPCTLNVNLLDLNGNTTKIFTFYEVYPLENLPIDVTMMKPNEFLIYQVLLNYREFTIKSVAQ